MNVPWHALGSSLWLRPLESADRPRVRAFLARGGLLRSGDPPEPGRAGGGHLVLATDPMGAPAGVFRIAGEADSGRVGFAVHAGDLPHLREALRLIAETARARTRWTRLVISQVPAHADLARTLFEAGWDREGASWVHAIDRERAPAATESAHAG